MVCYLYFRGETVMDSKSARSLFSASIALMMGLKYAMSWLELKHDLPTSKYTARLPLQVSFVPPGVIIDGQVSTTRMVSLWALSAQLEI